MDLTKKEINLIIDNFIALLKKMQKEHEKNKTYILKNKIQIKKPFKKIFIYFNNKI